MSEQDKAEKLLGSIWHWSSMDPGSFINVANAVTDVKAHEHRHMRAAMLYQSLEAVRKLTEQLDYPEELIIRNGECHVVLDGITLNALAIPIYLKHTGPRHVAIGRPVTEYLSRRGVVPGVAVDIGANFGEMSLWLAKKHPDAKVIAIEASADNARVLRRNLEIQDFSTTNITVVEKAVADYAGTVQFTPGVGTMAHIVRDGEQEQGLAIPCDRLESILAQHGETHADFIKIDIEGAEPLLEDSLRQLGQRVGHYFIEFSVFAPREQYLSLARTLMAAGYLCRTEINDDTVNLQELATFLHHHLDDQKELAQNIWFSRN